MPGSSVNPPEINHWLARHADTAGDPTLVTFRLYPNPVNCTLVAPVMRATQYGWYDPDEGSLDISIFNCCPTSLSRQQRFTEYHAAAIKAFVLEQQAAVQRARVLLEAHLTVKQRHDLTLRNAFLVQGGTSGAPYCIERKDTQNVYLRGAAPGGYNYRYCLVSQRGMPLDDLLLTQKILLECDEPGFLATAQRWETGRWPY